MDSKQIMDGLNRAALNKIKTLPCNNVRASEIGHPCERYLVLSITNWEDRLPHDATTQCIFDLGNAMEAETIRRLKEAGFELLTARKNFKIENPLISGREDIMLQDPETGELYPCEIKGLSPLAFDKIDSIEDMLWNKAYYIRKYPAQLSMYLYHHNKEKGFFILLNKVTGTIKAIEMPLDYEYTESLLQKAERVYKHISLKTLPDCIKDESICMNCPMNRICGVKIDRGNALIDNGDLEELLLERERLLPVVGELEEVKKKIKSIMRGCSRAFTASFMVEKHVIAKRPFIVAGSVYSKEVIRRIGGSHHEANQNIQ